MENIVPRLVYAEKIQKQASIVKHMRLYGIGKIKGCIYTKLSSQRINLQKLEMPCYPTARRRIAMMKNVYTQRSDVNLIYIEENLRALMHIYNIYQQIKSKRQ